MIGVAELTLDQVDQLLEQFRYRAATNAGRLARLKQALTGLGADDARAAQQIETQIREKTDHWRGEEYASISSVHRERRRRATAVVEATTRRLAAGVLGCAWDDPSWPDPGPATAQYIRIGTVSVGGNAYPAVLPLVGAPGWQVRSDERTFVGLAHAIILRSLVAYGPQRIRVHAFDPGLVSDIGWYAELRPVDRAAVRSPVTTTATFEESLAALQTELSRVEDALASYGFHSVLDEAADFGQLRHPLHLLIIYGTAGGLSDRGTQSLRQVLRTGAERGLFVLGTEDALQTLLPGVRPRLGRLSVRGRDAEHSALPGLTITLDRPPSRDQVQAAGRALLRRPAQHTAPTLPLAELIDAITDPWLDPGDKGIEVAYARSGRADLVLRLRSQDPPMPNAIIGGAVGEGKSNLLLTLIYGLAARYSPGDLDMVLLDLKDGVEFARFAPDDKQHNWLPHARVLGLEFDRTFALAVLQWLSELVQHRGALMRDAGVSNIAAYRQATGRSMPRTLVVIDEFHRLFEGEDDQVDTAARLLESLARTARSAGVHFVLASQTISGIRGLASKSDAIFAQFHNRISLKNTAAESQAILAPRNTAAATLTDRGEVIAHESLGEDPAANMRGLTAYAEAGYVRRLQERLWRQGSTGVPPRIFRASAYAPEVAVAPVAPPALLSLTPGAPISVTEDARVVSVVRSPDQGLLVLGTDRALVGPVLIGSVRSAVASRPDIAVTVLDGLTVAGYKDPVVAAVLSCLSELGSTVRHVGREDIVTTLADLRQVDPSATKPHLVLAMGFDGVVEIEQDDPATYVAPTEGLRSLVKIGALSGTVVMGWWQSRARAEEQLGFGLPGVRAVALCGLGAEDLRAVAGPTARPPEGFPRILWFDRGSQRGPEPLVPFTIPDELKGLLRG